MLLSQAIFSPVLVVGIFEFLRDVFVPLSCEPINLLEDMQVFDGFFVDNIQMSFGVLRDVFSDYRIVVNFLPQNLYNGV